MDAYFKTENLSVGYNGNILIRDINIEIEKGKILTLIGPNGAGKSTILKSISKQILALSGTVYIDNREISKWSLKEMSKNVAVVLTERIRPDMMTAFDVVAMGRYPYTNMVGRLTENDKEIIIRSLRQVNAESLAGADFLTLSDGQKQRIMLARAICQEPRVIILDEPTAYLDVRHKIELLDILREMAREKEITVIMSLHEIDLAAKISDYLLCVKGDTIESFGRAEEILKEGIIEKLFGLEKGSYNLSFGSVELTKPKGEPKVFVLAGGGYGTQVYRLLQRQQKPFATGILFENDVDCEAAKALCDYVVSVPAFEPMSEADFDRAAKLLLKSEAVIDAGTPIGALNELNGRLLKLAQEKNIPIHKYEAD